MDLQPSVARSSQRWAECRYPFRIINSDDPSLVAAMERFLGKSQVEIADIVRPVLEKHLSSVLATLSLEAVSDNPAACAARVQAAAASDLARWSSAWSGSPYGMPMRRGRAQALIKQLL